MTYTIFRNKYSALLLIWVSAVILLLIALMLHLSSQISTSTYHLNGNTQAIVISDESLPDYTKVTLVTERNSQEAYLPIDISSSNSDRKYTLPLIGGDEIKKIIIHHNASTEPSLHSFNSLPTRTNQEVLGVTDKDVAYSDTSFITQSGLQVITRSEWLNVAEESAEIITPEKITGIDIYQVPLLQSASEFEAVQLLYNYYINRCIEGVGYAPTDCTFEKTLKDIPFNYIITRSGQIYEGRAGGIGAPGLHHPGANRVSILILDETGKKNENVFQSSTQLVELLKEVYSLSTDQIRLYDHNQTLSDILQQINDDVSIYPQLLDSSEQDNHLTVKGKTQLLFESGGEASERVLQKYGAEETLAQINGVEILSVEEPIANQLINEIRLVDPESTIQPNYAYKIEAWDNSAPDRAVPTDYNSTTHWNLQKIKTPEIWKDLGGCASDQSCGGDPSVVVAVLDTGVAYEDYDYDAGGNYTLENFDPFDVEVPGVSTPNGIFNEGYDREYRKASELSSVNFVHPYDAWQDYSCNTLRIAGLNKVPCNPHELAKIDHANDDHGHGTFIAGIIGANTGDPSPNKVVGIAHNISIMPVKVFTPNDTSMCVDDFGDPDPTCSNPIFDYRTVAFTSTVIKGIEHAVDNGAKILNLSFGGQGNDPLVNSAIEYATSEGVMVVAAAGNDSDDATYYFPANSPGAFTVGATDGANKLASYSNYGGVIDLVAPAGDSVGGSTASIRYQCTGSNSCSNESNANLFKSFTSSTTPSTGIGTSYAAPMVAAAAALLWSDDPTLTRSEVEDLLRFSATDLGDSGFDEQFGYGLLNLEGALAREENVTPPENYDSYFTWYDTSKKNRKAWVLVGNPSTTQSANVNIKIGNKVNKNYVIAPGQNITPKWDGLLDGPVKVTSLQPIYTTQRVVFEGSFNEYSGIPVDELTNKYYFTWYDTSKKSRKAWVLVGNPSTTQTANVNIRISNTSINQNFKIPPGGRITPQWSGILNGPVTVTSDIDIYATQRVIYDGTFNEFPGIPADRLTDKYYFTWYDTSKGGRNTWILVGNPSDSASASVNIKIQGTSINKNFVIPPGKNITAKWDKVLNGPVTVTANREVYATQRVVYDGSFNEYSGIPVDTLKTKYYFTWYDTSKKSRKAWVLVGNPSTTQSASVNIKIGNKVNKNFTIPPGGRITPSWSGVLAGPVVVSSNRPVYSTQRVLFDNDFNEYPGITPPQ